MLHLVLLEPEIPQNAGNIARTCVAVGARLHLIEPLGFRLDDRYLKRAGLDYWRFVDLAVHRNLEDFYRACGATAEFFYFSARGRNIYTEAALPGEAYCVFGKESAGLPGKLLEANPGRAFRIPMREGPRSLNVSNAAALIAYEYARRRGFPDMA